MTTRAHRVFGGIFISQNGVVEPEFSRRQNLELMRRFCRINPALGIRMSVRAYSSGEITKEEAAYLVGLTVEQYEVLVHHYQAGDLDRISGKLKEAVDPRFTRMLTCLTKEQVELLECLMDQDILFPVNHVGVSHPLLSDLIVLAVLKLVKTSWHTSRLLRFELDLPKPSN